MITRRDCLLLLSELSVKGINTDAMVKLALRSQDINLEVIKFINSNRQLDEEESLTDDLGAESDDLSGLFGDEGGSSDFDSSDTSFNFDTDFGSSETPSESSAEGTDATLPSPEELGIGDLSDSTNPELET